MAETAPSGPQRRPRTPRRWQAAVPVAAALAGVLFVASAVSSDGTDLRSSDTDLQVVVDDRAQAVHELRHEVDDVQAEVDQLGATVDDAALRQLRRRIARAGVAAGLAPVSGPGLVVSLADSPVDDPPDDIDPNLLVVHQQDIQAFVNALWAGGAIGITLQGQRLVSTTGIKCVGNTVVLEGVPYAPPYRIEAVGDPDALVDALGDAADVQTYREYAQRYFLGLDVERSDRLFLPAYEGLPVMDYATAGS